MNKEEILERSRQAGEDEGMEHTENHGRIVGYFAFSIFYLIIVIFDWVFGDGRTAEAVSSLCFILLASQTYIKYRFARQKTYLVIAIIGSISSLAFAASYIIITLLG